MVYQYELDTRNAGKIQYAALPILIMLDMESHQVNSFETRAVPHSQSVFDCWPGSAEPLPQLIPVVDDYKAFMPK